RPMICRIRDVPTNTRRCNQQSPPQLPIGQVGAKKR
ncbi:MAG: hypothetical protein ACI8XO_003332, partial [Verrucomicrobiales bacterium]